MTKELFLGKIRQGLEGLPQEDVEKSLDYYTEMIEDCMEEGMGEEEAVAEMGDVNEIISFILMETPLPKLVRAKTKPNRTLRAWEIVFLVFGFPIWGALLISLGAVVFSIYISLWSVIVSLFATDFSLLVSGIGCLLGGVIFACMGYSPQALLCIGAGFLLVGLSIFFFFICHLCAKGCIWLSKWILRAIKRMFIGKRGEKNA